MHPEKTNRIPRVAIWDDENDGPGDAETALIDGELLPGIERTEERESFTVKFGKAD